MRCTILFDIDGTLIENGKYPENFDSIGRQIKQINDSNNFIMGICTFRPLNPVVKTIIKDYNLNGILITEGGACVYKKIGFIYMRLYRNKKVKTNLKRVIKKLLLNYNKKNNNSIPVIVSNELHNKDVIIINKHRKQTSTIRIPLKDGNQVYSIIQFLKSNRKLNNMNIIQSNENKLKINVYSIFINKIKVIHEIFKNEQVVLITDFEENIPIYSTSIKIYSVGTNKIFNKCCDKIFSPFGKGVEEILKEILEEIRSKK